MYGVLCTAVFTLLTEAEEGVVKEEGKAAVAVPQSPAAEKAMEQAMKRLRDYI